MIAKLPGWLRPAPDSNVANDIRRGKSPWTDAVHMLWSIWVFITPAMSDGYNWTWAAITLVTYPLFVILFVTAQFAPASISYRYGLALAALGIVLVPWYPSGISYVIYGCVLVRSKSISFNRYYLRLVAINAVCLTVCWYAHYPWQVMISVPAMTFVIGTIINVERLSEEKDSELRLSQDEVRRLAATAERERIGRDLHDLLGHTLSLITLKLELSRRLFDRDNDAARREVGEAEAVARHALAEVRAAVSGIRATGMAGELAAAKLLLNTSGVHFDYDSELPELPAATEGALALVLREAVTNIHRHARATRAEANVAVVDGQIALRISDDGRGCHGDEGNGLCGMRERVRALGGTLELSSLKGQGTRLQVGVPLPATVHPLPQRVLPREAEDAGRGEQRAS
ncbi:MAG TPA: sensor histidine kinase [Luteibacter sp.]|jgi:two-component system sensor histidine kinase DesK|nr:sensor histidine kinase [Luteibacter sp.]